MRDAESSDQPSSQCSMAIRDQLQTHLGTGKKLRVRTHCTSHGTLNGFLMGLSEQLGLMHCFHDFMPDGYTVFRLTDVASIRSSEYERLWDRMLVGEGLLDGLHQELHIDLESVLTAIETISHQFQFMIVRVEVPQSDIKEFYIGQAVSWDVETVQFDEFDALGQWVPESSMITTDEIAFIEFDSQYHNCPANGVGIG